MAAAPVELPKTNAVVQPSAVVNSDERKSFLLAMIVAGAVLLIGIVGVGVVWMLRSRSKPRASLITRSIDRDPK